MDIFFIIGVLFFLYYLISILLLLYVDCNLGLLWYLYFRKNLSAFKDKVIWVTGASSGIGEFMAVEFAKHGAKLILTARSESNLENVKKRCIEESGAKPDDIRIIPLDVTDESKHKDVFERAVNCFGKLHILVNNAGRSQRCPFEDVDTGVDREMFDLNLFAALSLSRMAVKYFQNANIEGQLVITSSIAGLFEIPFSCSYNGSKHAIHGYFKTLRLEKLGSKISVTILCPGPVFSNFLQNCFTGKPGEKFGQAMQKDDKRLTTDRCAYLAAVAIANRVDEAWMGLFPCVPLIYIFVYYPYLAKGLCTILGVKGLMNMRDSRQTVTKKE